MTPPSPSVSFPSDQPPKLYSTITASEPTTTDATRTEQHSSDDTTREERRREEMLKAKSMKVTDLRKDLESMGISTRSFFEKYEFVNAYAEAIVDGKGAKRTTKQKATKRRATKNRMAEEPHDPSFRDVETRKLDMTTKEELLNGNVIGI